MNKDKSKISVEVNVTEGPNAGRKFTFDRQDVFIIGRADDCSCVVADDPTFSRHHMLIEINQNNVTLKDLGSLNGTMVNDVGYGGRDSSVAPEDAEPGKPVPLRDGDRIKAGKNVMVLSIDAPAICVDCGKEIPEKERKASEFINGTYLCLDCRRKEEEQHRKPESEKKPEDVKISQKQRKRAEDDPAEVIDELFRELFGVCKKHKEPIEIKGYKNLKMVGRGGFGAVYCAERVSDGKAVAVKTMLQTRKPPEKLLRMFEREKKVTEQLHHRNIVRTTNAGIWKDIHFIEMEFLKDGSVYDLMEKGIRRLSLEMSIPIMLDVLEGLAYAHNAEIAVETRRGKKTVKGVIHRDLKPPNILLGEENGKLVAKISDFGLAKAFATAGCTQGSITMGAGAFCGSPPYMAPEHIINYRYVEPVTDVFELAATFFHMLTGEIVWPMEGGADPCKVILESRPRCLKDFLPSASKKLCKVFDNALALDVNQRYKNAGEFLKAFKKAV